MRMRILSLALAAALAGCASTPRKISGTGEKNSTHELAYQKISVPSADGSTLEALLFRPSGPGPFPAIVALHGCAGLYKKDGSVSARDLEWGSRLAGKGYVAIFPDSFTTRGMKEICTNAESLDIPRKVRPLDAYGALNWLATQPYVRADSVGIMGWSNGGSSLLWTIDRHSPLAPRDGFRDFRTAIAFYPGCRAAEKEPTWESRVPLEMLIGELDDWILPDSCRALVDRAGRVPEVNITLYADSYHDFDAPNLPLTVRHHLAFSRGKDRSATIGTNEIARQAAVKKVFEILDSKLKR